MTAEAVLSKLRDSRGILVDLSAIPMDDHETYGLISRGDTAGVRRFDHADALVHLRRLAPDRFAHLVAFQALNRMSMLATGMMDRYIARRHGLAEAACEIPALSPWFAASYGLPLYREQLRAIACDVAAFDPGEAERFAAAFCRFDEASMPGLSARFVEGAARRGVGPGEGAEMVAFFRRTASFMLPERMVAGFAEEGYRLAWLKTHYRAEFEAAIDGIPACAGASVRP